MIEKLKNNFNLGEFINQLSCITNHEQNIRLINGNLVLTAVYQDRQVSHYKKDFTSSYIYSNNFQLHIKFELRAALAHGHLLRSLVSLQKVNPYDKVWYSIVLFDYQQGDTIDVGFVQHTSR